MPIKLNVVDNNSSVRVKPRSKDEVPVKPDCGIDNARYEALVNKEKQERIAADEVLQKQILDNKINFIPLDSYITEQISYQKSGVLPEIILQHLRDNRINKLLLGNKIYYLSIKAGDTQQYFTNTSNNIPNEPSFNKVDLNISTGEFIITDSWLDAQMKRAIAHMKDKNIHLQPGEREFWNNKVTAYPTNPTVDPIDGTISNTLVLDRNNTIDENGNFKIR